MRRFSRPSDSSSRITPKAVAAIVTLAVGVVSCASFEHLTQVSDVFPEAEDCGKCHIDIYEEWSVSDHAQAHTNPHFVVATGDHAFEDCLSCHAPEPRLTADAPGLRSSSREEGITCVACHLSEDALCGPLEPTGKVKPHPIGVRPEVYQDAGLCGRCHQGTLEQWESVAGDKQICQQCHMPEITRKMTQSSGGFSNVIVAMEHETPQRRHVFAIPSTELIREMIEIEVNRLDADIEVIVHNRLPHSLPTGDYGFRILVLDLWTRDNQGAEQALTHIELAPEMKTHIPALGAWRCLVTVPADSAALRLHLRRCSYDDQPVLDLVDQVVELGSRDAG